MLAARLHREAGPSSVCAHVTSNLFGDAALVRVEGHRETAHALLFTGVPARARVYRWITEVAVAMVTGAARVTVQPASISRKRHQVSQRASSVHDRPSDGSLCRLRQYARDAGGHHYER